MIYKVILILRNNQRFFIIKQHWNFFKIYKCEDRLDAAFISQTFSAAQNLIYTTALVYCQL